MNKRLIGKCPYCNGLFEARDLKEDHAKCQWCSNEIGTVEYVELGDDRLLLTELLQDREELSGLGVDHFDRHIGSLSVPLFSLVPFIYFIYGKAVGEDTAWYIYLLMVVGAFILFGVWKSYADGEKKYKELKKLVERHDYSLVGLSSEMEIQKKEAAAILEEDSTSDKGELCKDMSEILGKLIPYVIARGSVREGYADGKSEGVRAIGDSNSEHNAIEFIYIVPPSHCPACNYIYKQGDKQGTAIVCPHCSITVRLVDENVRTQSQMMVRDFLLRAAQSQAKATSKNIIYIAAFLAVISVVMMAYMGIEEFFFSWAVLLWLSVSLMLVVGYDQDKVLHMLKDRAAKGVPDLLELEMIVKQYAVVLIDEFIVLKAEIIKTLNK